MTYISLYRKYRSQTFDEIVGQEAIVTTLKNAIISSRLSHAYLFTGPRGTGKTSLARIFSKALNCEKGATPSPCGKCEQCRKITDGFALNVMEIDAASNRGIDEIRDLRDKIKYKPVEGRYKIYIIDEVHMLTNEAFNALLKTLEEPPQDTIFVLATTEPQKIPVTISSRCMKFDFSRINLSKIEAHLKIISQKEKILVEDEALSMISRASEGSLRDAISLLDQLISFCSEKISSKDVAFVLGTAESGFLFEVSNAVYLSQDKEVFELTQKAFEEGVSIPKFTKDLIMHFRNILIAKIGSESILDLTKEHIERLKNESSKYSLDNLKYIIRELSRADVDMKWHQNSRLVLEVALLNILDRGWEPNEQQATPLRQMAGQIPNLKQADGLQLTAYDQKLKMNSEMEKQKSEEIHTEDLSVNRENIILIKNNWPGIMNKMKEKSLFGFVSLQEAEPCQIDEKGYLVLSFKKGYSFHKSRIEQKANKDAIESSIKEIISLDVPIKCLLTDIEPQKKATDAVSLDEVVDLFDGKVIN